MIEIKWVYLYSFKNNCDRKFICWYNTPINFIERKIKIILETKSIIIIINLDFFIPKINYTAFIN